MPSGCEDYDDYDEYEDVEGAEEHPRDPEIDKEKESVLGVFEDKTRVMYNRQVEVLLERRFFHWITNKALRELVDEGKLSAHVYSIERELHVKCMFNPKHRYYKRQARELVDIIRKYSNPLVTDACGKQAENIFLNGLAVRRFLPVGRDINEYRGKKWVKTNENLEYIVERDDVAYGCEVKNRLDYIERDELESKLEMCRFLGVRPLFIMRHSPKSYNKLIIDEGGYAMIFITQIYPPGFQGLVREIEEKTGLPVICSSRVPDTIMDRFEKWHRASL